MSPELSSDASFWGRFEDSAVAVRVEEGSRGNADVKMIPRERIEAEVEKVR